MGKFDELDLITREIEVGLSIGYFLARSVCNKVAWGFNFLGKWLQ